MKINNSQLSNIIYRNNFQFEQKQNDHQVVLNSSKYSND